MRRRRYSTFYPKECKSFPSSVHPFYQVCFPSNLFRSNFPTQYVTQLVGIYYILAEVIVVSSMFIWLLCREIYYYSNFLFIWIYCFTDYYDLCSDDFLVCSIFQGRTSWIDHIRQSSLHFDRFILMKFPLVMIILYSSLYY